MQKNRKKEKNNSTKREKGRKMMQEGKREKMRHKKAVASKYDDKMVEARESVNVCVCVYVCVYLECI